MAPAQHKSMARIKQEIIRFLDRTCGLPDKKPGKHSCGMIHRNALVLATSFRDVPRATPLEFFHEGLTLYVFGEPGGKIANIKRNSTVSAAIYEQPLDHSKRQQSLQVFGKAELISVRNNPRLMKAKARKWNLFKVLDVFMKAQSTGAALSAREQKLFAEKMLSSINLIKITPHHIILREYNPDIRMPKYEWKKAGTR